MDKKIKCVVWDLDNTLWNGTLAEKDAVRVTPRVRQIIEDFDRRGILQSLASRNDAEPAMAALKDAGVDEYFLFPQIHWSVKSGSVTAISKALNIGLDTIAFIDDQPFEREEVAHEHPMVRCYDAADIDGIPDRPEFVPASVTDEARQRRLLYVADINRNEAEKEFVGPKQAFLEGLGMILTIKRADFKDLERAHELTARTSQMNTTGYSYSMEELTQLLNSPDHLFLVAALSDKYGSYGTIGLVIVDLRSRPWLIKLLLASCRVMSRGVGTILLNYIVETAHRTGTTATVEYRPNDRNKMFFMTCRLAGFKESGNDGELLLLSHGGEVQPKPSYMTMEVSEEIECWYSRAGERVRV